MVKKKSTKKEPTKTISKKEWEMQKLLIENSVSLQKVVVDLSTKFEKLTNQISDLLGLFEKSAKSFAERQTLNEKDKEFLAKIDKLMEQNKTIAQGLTLMEKKIKKQPPEENTEEDKDIEMVIPKPLPEI